MKNKLKLIGLFSVLVFFACSDDEKIVFINGDEVSDDIIIIDPSDAPTASEITIEMGPGFNLGNTFDNGINPATFASVKNIIDKYHEAGMKHIRIPTTWMEGFSSNLADNNGNINAGNQRLIELGKVIDYAIAKDLYVVLNTHHEHWLKDFYDGSATYDDRFANLWTNIANRFADYPYKLIFEVINEPEGNLGEWDGTGPFPDPTTATALEYTRRVNKVGYDAIRATGGLNANRFIMISTNGQGNDSMIEEVYPSRTSLPGGGTDPFLGIQVHSYNPWAFCGQTGSNAAFPGTAFYDSTIQAVKIHAGILNVPINYGEFGVGRASNVAERNTDLVRNYYRNFANTTIGQQMSYSVWDDRGWFGLINDAGTTFTNNIVPYMLQ